MARQAKKKPSGGPKGTPSNPDRMRTRSSPAGEGTPRTMGTRSTPASAATGRGSGRKITKRKRGVNRGRRAGRGIQRESLNQQFDRLAENLERGKNEDTEKTEEVKVQEAQESKDDQVATEEVQKEVNEESNNEKETAADESLTATKDGLINKKASRRIMVYTYGIVYFMFHG